MAEPFIAEVKLMGFNFPPRGWALCDGQILPINQNQSLYSLVGTTYGGDGRTSFALPDLRGRTPVHPGSGTSGQSIELGQKTGQENHVLTDAELPSHTHSFECNTNLASSKLEEPNNAVLRTRAAGNYYKAYNASNNGAMATGTIVNAGGSQAHNNMQPWTAVTFCIALQGLFPPRN